MNGKRLGSVLRVRHLQERAARGALASSRNVHRVAESAERDTWDSLDTHMATSVRGSRPAVSLRGSQLLVASGMLAAERQHLATVAAADVLAEATTEWTLAARRVEGLERLVERQNVAEREEAVRRSSNEIDDLVLMKFATGAT